MRSTALDIKASQGEGQKLQIQLDLPLDNPEIQDATLALLRGINPVTGGPADTAAAAAQLKEAVLQNAKAQIRTYDTSSTRRAGRSTSASVAAA